MENGGPGSWSCDNGQSGPVQSGGQIWKDSLLPMSGHLETFAQLDLQIFKVSTLPFKMSVLFHAVFLCCYYMLGGNGEVQITCRFGS